MEELFFENILKKYKKQKKYFIGKFFQIKYENSYISYKTNFIRKNKCKAFEICQTHRAANDPIKMVDGE